MQLDELMLVETLAAPDQRYPGLALRPIDAGYVLTWAEHHRHCFVFERKGMVLGLAPLPNSVWVQPDDPKPGEGLAVVVNEVTAKHGAAGARRQVDGPGDYLSTARWQAPRSLPRAVLRTDQVAFGDSMCWFLSLHADPGCPVDEGWRCVGGRLDSTSQVVRDDCYVFDRWLHPLSARPVDRERPVRLCGRCLEEGRPT